MAERWPRGAPCSELRLIPGPHRLNLFTRRARASRDPLPPSDPDRPVGGSDPFGQSLSVPRCGSRVRGRRVREGAQRRLHAARGLAAAVLVAVAALLALPLPAQAQHPSPSDPSLPAQSEILVSNVGRTTGTHSSLITLDMAQAFTTGTKSAGYTLTSVELDMLTSDENAAAFTVSIHSNSSGAPGTSLGTLSNPSSLTTSGVHAFTTRGIALAAETTYFVVIDSVGGVTGLLLSINNTTSDAQDPGKAPGWSIGDDSLYRN